MYQNNQISIPAFDLQHENHKVDFALRTMEEIHARQGNKPDLPHRHNYFTILWASKACGQHFIDYREHLITPHLIFFVNPGQVHQVITFGEPEGLVIMFTREFLQQNNIPEEFISNLGLFSETADTPPLKLDKNSSNRLHEIASQMRNSFNSDDRYKSESLGAYLKLFLIECNKMAPQLATNNTQTLQSGRIILKSFKALVEQYFHQWHKVSEYASKLHITSDYLNNVVKASIGKTAKEFIQERIILEAKRMGLHTDLSNKEIAFRLGFDDPSHFSKFFSTSHGESFSDFRSSLEKSMAGTN
ncbi:MAG: helix-turn-helix domain-containing protein [Bacteroidota bacterium]|nr:MAG: helix-turn-helix domain-containing protein [Bacteroidota bacterium]